MNAQMEFGWFPARSVVRVFRRWLASGAFNTRITYAQWLEWHAVLNGGER